VVQDQLLAWAYPVRVPVPADVDRNLVVLELELVLAGPVQVDRKAYLAAVQVFQLCCQRSNS